MKKLKPSHEALLCKFFVIALLFSTFAAFMPAFAQTASPSVTDPFGTLVNNTPKEVTNTLSSNGFDFSAITKSLSGIGEGLGSFANNLFSKFDQAFSGFSSIFGNFFSSLFSSVNKVFGSLTSLGDLSTAGLSSTSGSTGSSSSSTTPAASGTSTTPASSDSTTTPAAADASSTGGSADNQKVVKCAEKYINSTQFRGAEVSFGKKACAQFVSTALKDAGVLSNTILGVPDLVKALKGKGYSQVTAPPFKGGDIVTWRTYDRNGDGRKDDDTHVGIMCFDGKALSNSSSARMPRKHDVNYQPICKVLRKA